MGHGYVFSVAVGTIVELLNLVPFLSGDETIDSEKEWGGGGWLAGLCLHIKKGGGSLLHIERPLHFCRILDSLST